MAEPLVELLGPGEVQQISVAHPLGAGATKICPSPLFVHEVPRDADELVEVRHGDLVVLFQVVEHPVQDLFGFRSSGQDDVVEVVRTTSTSGAALFAFLTIPLPRGS